MIFVFLCNKETALNWMCVCLSYMRPRRVYKNRVYEIVSMTKLCVSSDSHEYLLPPPPSSSFWLRSTHDIHTTHAAANYRYGICICFGFTSYIAHTNSIQNTTQPIHISYCCCCCLVSHQKWYVFEWVCSYI